MALFSDYFTDPLRGYRRYFDVSSFIDYIIISELSRKIDAYRKSRYFYKKKDSNGSLLHAGPVWDFDWAWKNIRDDQLGATDGSGRVSQFKNGQRAINSPHWYNRLLQDPAFVKQLVQRYFELRSDFINLATIGVYIDSVGILLSAAKERHFALWPIELDYRAPEWEPPSLTYEEEITKLKSWIEKRLNWVDGQFIQMRSAQTIAVSQSIERAKDGWIVRAFPNPAITSLSVESNVPLRQVAIYNVTGRLTLLHTCDQSYSEIIHFSKQAAGIYFLKITAVNGAVVIRKQTFINY